MNKRYPFPKCSCPTCRNMTQHVKQSRKKHLMIGWNKKVWFIPLNNLADSVLVDWGEGVKKTLSTEQARVVWDGLYVMGFRRV